MEDSNFRKLSFKEQVENYIYNMKFYFDFNSLNLISHTSDRVYLLGKVYQAVHKNNFKYENDRIKKDFEQIIWITYR